MKKQCFGVCAVFLILSGMLSANEKIKISVKPETGMIYGTVGEYVYFVPEDDEIRKLSQLDWDVRNLWYAGFNLEMTGKDCGVSFYSKFGFSKYSGCMQDYDWMNAILFPEDNWLTHYSKHENKITSYYKFGISAGRSFSIVKNFWVKPSIYLEKDKISFSAYNGYYTYAVEDKNNKYGKIPEEKTAMKGELISYSQDKNFIGMGLETGICFAEKFEFTADGKIRIANVEAIDCHYLKFIKYKDIPFGYGGFSCGASCHWMINKNQKISLNANYDSVPLMIGENFYTDLHSKNWLSSKDKYGEYLGGVSSTFFEASLSYTYTF